MLSIFLSYNILENESGKQFATEILAALLNNCEEFKTFNYTN